MISVKVDEETERVALDAFGLVVDMGAVEAMDLAREIQNKAGTLARAVQERRKQEKVDAIIYALNKVTGAPVVPVGMRVRSDIAVLIEKFEKTSPNTLA